jgi:hypothetical protein
MATKVSKILQYIKQFHSEKLSADRVEFFWGRKWQKLLTRTEEHTENILLKN